MTDLQQPPGDSAAPPETTETTDEWDAFMAPDVVVLDTDADDVGDTVLVDTDSDGDVDVALIDTDDDQEIDMIVIDDEVTDFQSDEEP